MQSYARRWIRFHGFIQVWWYSPFKLPRWERAEPWIRSVLMVGCADYRVRKCQWTLCCNVACSPWYCQLTVIIFSRVSNKLSACKENLVFSKINCHTTLNTVSQLFPVSNVVDPWHFGTDSVPDQDPAIFLLDLQKAPTKTYFFLTFLIITFWRYIYIIFLR